MNLRKKTIAGIIWNFAEQIGKRGIMVVVTLLLARFLAPADFGLIAMMAVFLAVAQSLMDSGFKQSLIRLQGAEQVDFNTAFYANICLGIISYILLFLAAPYIAQFYEEPRLIILIRMAGLNILIHSFQVVQSAILSRELNFKVQLQATIPAGIISGIIAVGMAYKGYGVWALIVQMLLASLIATILLWKLQGWRPSLSFSGKSLGFMYNFGYKLFLSGLLNTIFLNTYIVVIAKIFTATVAGHYFFANKIKDLVVTQLVGSIQNVTYPALATFQNDNDRLKEGYRKIMQVTTFILFPSIFLLAVLAEPLFNVLLPDKWLPAVIYLQLLCFSAILFPLHVINLNILKIKGRSDLFLYVEIIKKTTTISILVISFRYGVIGILLGQIVSSILAYIPNSYFSSKLIDYPIRKQMADFIPGLVLATVVGVAVYGAGFMINWPASLELASLACLAGILYLFGAHLLNLQAYILVRQMVMERLGKV